MTAKAVPPPTTAKAATPSTAISQRGRPSRVALPSARRHEPRRRESASQACGTSCQSSPLPRSSKTPQCQIIGEAATAIHPATLTRTRGVRRGEGIPRTRDPAQPGHCRLAPGQGRFAHSVRSTAMLRAAVTTIAAGLIAAGGILRYRSTERARRARPQRRRLDNLSFRRPLRPESRRRLRRLLPPRTQPRTRARSVERLVRRTTRARRLPHLARSTPAFRSAHARPHARPSRGIARVSLRVRG